MGHDFFGVHLAKGPSGEGLQSLPLRNVGRACQSQLCLCAIILHPKEPVCHCFISSSGEPNFKALPVRTEISSAPHGQDDSWEQHS